MASTSIACCLPPGARARRAEGKEPGGARGDARGRGGVELMPCEVCGSGRRHWRAGLGLLPISVILGSKIPSAGETVAESSSRSGLPVSGSCSGVGGWAGADRLRISSSRGGRPMLTWGRREGRPEPAA
jgi:hypothetical protein